MIEIRDLCFSYDERPIVDGLDLELPEGELLVVVGPTGSGKSTLLKMLNGLVPHYSGGELSGELLVDGRRASLLGPVEMADLVGYVGQDPAAGFVTDRVEDEIAYAMENLGIEPTAMRRRVEDALDLMGLHQLRDRRLSTLSGGQRQRVAIASVLASSPRLLVLDEPTSALDPAAAEEVLSSITRLVHDLGLTVVMAEHRLERVLPFADRILLLDGRGGASVGDPSTIMATSPLSPPLIGLGRLAGWDPLPVTVRDARRRSADLVARLGTSSPPARRASGGREVASTEGLVVDFDGFRALSDVSVAVEAGTITALMGRNGSGKSTLLGALAGLHRPSAGRASASGRPSAALEPVERICLVGMVPQEAGSLLYAQTVGAECEEADREHELEPGTTRAALERIAARLPWEQHPRDLSEGQRLSLALAVVLAPRPLCLLLDEPTRGLDYEAKEALCDQLRSLRDSGAGIMIATHDVELVAMVADRAVVLAQGEVIADGEAHEVVCHSPAFAPQVSKVLSPASWLTVDEVADALAGAGS